MKHYKIEKKTYYGINVNGELLEQVKFRPYRRVLWFFWIQLQTTSLFYDGSNPSTGNKVAFSNIENAEKFIYKYHSVRNKVNSYTIETVEKINLED